MYPLPVPLEGHPTRRRILDTARRLFHERGFHATGVSAILREADVNSGSLHHCFPSREALPTGVLVEYLNRFHPMATDPVERTTTDAIGRVFAFLSFYRQELRLTGFKLGCPIGNLALEVGDDNGEAPALIDQNFHHWSEVVHGWLTAAGDRLPGETDRGQLAGFILTTLEGAMMRARAAMSSGPFDGSVGQLRACFDHLETAARASHSSRAVPVWVSRMSLVYAALRPGRWELLRAGVAEPAADPRRRPNTLRKWHGS